MNDVFEALARHKPEQRLRMGLNAVREALLACGAPDAGRPALVVSGTNGKGSTCRFLEARLRRRGFRVGTYASPHVLHPTERVRIDGRQIDRDDFGERLNRLWRRHPELTYFELMTVTAIAAFADAGVEWMVLEVGLGGRLDAVNAVRDVRGTAVTSIGFDHMDVLGPTLAAIAGEKAGILRAGVPCIVGDLPPEARAVIEARARSLAAPLFPAVRPRLPEWDGPEWLTVNLGVATALERAVFGDAPAPEIGELANRPLGRWTVLPGRPFRVVDGAHNPEGAAALAAALAPHGPLDIWLLVGAGKDLPGLLAPLRAVAARWFVIDDADPAWHSAAVVRAALGTSADVKIVAAAEAPAAFERSPTAACWCGSLRALNRLSDILPPENPPADL